MRRVKTVLVTGGAGYVGSHACKALAKKGHEPIVYDNLSRGHDWAVKWGPLEKGDISDIVRLHDVLERHRPAAVMHFAAYIEAGESMRSPGLFFANNVSGSLNLIEASVRHGVTRMDTSRPTWQPVAGALSTVTGARSRFQAIVFICVLLLQ